MPCLIPRGISLKQLMCSLFLSFDLEQFFHFAKCTLAVLLFHLVSCRFIPFNICSTKFDYLGNLNRDHGGVSQDLTRAECCTSATVPGNTFFSLQGLRLDRMWFIGLKRACPEPFSAKRHQFNLSIFLNRVIKGLVCFGSRPSDSRSS